MTPKFRTAPDGVDPAAVPFMTTYNGSRIPAIGLGTFGSDNYGPMEIAAAVLGAAEVGYRHFDCASVYANEKEIGGSLRAVMDGGISRDELYITSKVWNDAHDDVIASCRRSLASLGLEYLDLYLVHWPFPNCHPPGCGAGTRSPDAKPYIHENFMKTWQQMEKLADMGLVKEIGTSNLTPAKLKLILRDARLKPAANQMELHPHFQQPELFDLVTANGIIPIGYSPLGSPSRPERDKTANDTVDMEDDAITAPAKRLGIHPAAICVKWARQRGQIPIPFSAKRRQYLANIQAVTGEELTEEEMAAIARADKNCRLIKGQVFLWKDGQSWEDLWDPNGEISPP
ncbi:MAG: aldo/keto reductase [spirochete symbiont of Stewartia floridana]|nr:MAG: aldo/keto reductase [spirochete symbiont of Stewartia floridana]